MKQQVSTSRKSQNNGNNRRKNLNGRIEQLESLVYSLGAEPSAASTGSLPSVGHEQSNSVTTDSNASTPSRSRSPFPASKFESAPVVSLFDNSTLPYNSIKGDHRPDCPRKAELQRKCERLLAVFPHPDIEKRLLAANAFYWHCLHHTWPGLLGFSDTYGAPDFVADAKKSGNVAAIAKALLIVSVSMQEASPEDAAFLGDDRTNRQQLADRYIGIVQEELYSDDDLMVNLDAIECFVLSLKYDLNLGRVRRAWTSIRRAVSLAQLCGFHRLPHLSKQKDPETTRASALWKSLFATDRWISMLAGLPYSVPDVFAPPCNGNSHGADSAGFEDAGSYFIALTRIVGHVVERNQALASSRSLAKTIAIEGEMMELAATRSEEWWTLPDNLDLTPENMAVRFMPQFWHWQGRLLNHLPLMLKAGRESKYTFSRLAALESARKMLRLFKLLRPAHGFASNLCKVIDFQVFTAAMALVLNHFGGRVSISCTGAGHDNFPSTSTVTPSIAPSTTTDCDEEDLQLLTDTTAIMTKARVQIDETVVKEATRALELFIRGWKHGDFTTQGPAKLMVPYYGVVEFEGRGGGQHSSPSSKQQQQHNNSHHNHHHHQHSNALDNNRRWTYPTPPRSHSSLSYPSSATTTDANSNPNLPPSLSQHNSLPTSTTTTQSPSQIDTVQQTIYDHSPSQTYNPSNPSNSTYSNNQSYPTSATTTTGSNGSPPTFTTTPNANASVANGVGAGAGVGAWNWNANDPFLANNNNSNNATNAGAGWNWNVDLTDDWGWFWDNTRFAGMEGLVDTATTGGGAAA